MIKMKSSLPIVARTSRNECGDIKSIAVSLKTPNQSHRFPVVLMDMYSSCKSIPSSVYRIAENGILLYVHEAVYHRPTEKKN